MSDNYRTERDSLGEVRVPESAEYGAQTQRAVDNFSIGEKAMPVPFIVALARIKQAAALTNRELGLLPSELAAAISQAAAGIAENPSVAQFPVSVYQTGSGTSSNMNMNEVLAHRASALCGESVHPNDHVNMGQSSNDTIPTAIHVSALMTIDQKLFPALRHLCQTIESKGEELANLVKTGRTHLMDAMPLTLKQEFSGWRGQIHCADEGLHQACRQLESLAQGGTAIGTGINAHPEFADRFTRHLSELTRLTFRPSTNFFASLSGQEAAVGVSGQLKALACALMKISNDLRWMNSGPLSGLGEIELEALQPGSSIMPGKVNPVIPEAVTMACAQVMANDTAITLAAQSGNFQLNVMLPLIADRLLESISLLGDSCISLADKAIASLEPKPEQLQRAVGMNPVLVTALNSVIGYAKAAEIAKAAYRQQRPVLDVAEEMTDLGREKLEQLLDPEKLTRGGIPE